MKRVLVVLALSVSLAGSVVPATAAKHLVDQAFCR